MDDDYYDDTTQLCTSQNLETNLWDSPVYLEIDADLNTYKDSVSLACGN